MNVFRNGRAMPSFRRTTLRKQTGACSVGNQCAGGAEGVAYAYSVIGLYVAPRGRG